MTEMEFIISYKYGALKCFSFWGDRIKEAVEEFNNIAERKLAYANCKERISDIELFVRVLS